MDTCVVERKTALQLNERCGSEMHWLDVEAVFFFSLSVLVIPKTSGSLLITVPRLYHVACCAPTLFISLPVMHRFTVLSSPEMYRFTVLKTVRFHLKKKKKRNSSQEFSNEFFLNTFPFTNNLFIQFFT